LLVQQVAERAVSPGDWSVEAPPSEPASRSAKARTCFGLVTPLWMATLPNLAKPATVREATSQWTWRVHRG